MTGGGIRLGDGASVSDYVNIYSHSHDVVNSPEITNRMTVVGAGVRIAYHATILTGVTLGDDSMIGAGAIVSRDTEGQGSVYAGIPGQVHPCERSLIVPEEDRLRRTRSRGCSTGRAARPRTLPPGPSGLSAGTGTPTCSSASTNAIGT